MKEITEELLNEIKEYAGLMFSKREIAAIVELSAEQLEEMLFDKNGIPFRTFQAGRLKQEALIRRSIFDLAKNGSSPAQAFAVRLIENAKLDDL